MDGPYDNNLPWPTSGMLKITLANQISDNEHYPPIEVTCSYNSPVSRGKIKQVGFIKRYINYDHLYQDTDILVSLH